MRRFTFLRYFPLIILYTNEGAKSLSKKETKALKIVAYGQKMLHSVGCVYVCVYVISNTWGIKSRGHVVHQPCDSWTFRTYVLLFPTTHFPHPDKWHHKRDPTNLVLELIGNWTVEQQSKVKLEGESYHQKTYNLIKWHGELVVGRHHRELERGSLWR